MLAGAGCEGGRCAADAAARLRDPFTPAAGGGAGLIWAELRRELLLEVGEEGVEVRGAHALVAVGEGGEANQYVRVGEL